MSDKSKTEDFFNNLLSRIQNLDGKIVGNDMNKSKTRLAKDDKGAWINHLADQCINKETIDEIPEELNISMKDVANEIARREVEKAWE